jgi:hypothetical protein
LYEVRLRTLRYLDHKHKKYPPCVKCGYLGFAFDVSWTDEQVQDYARKAQAMVAECRMLTEDEISSCEVFTCEVCPEAIQLKFIEVNRLTMKI